MITRRTILRTIPAALLAALLPSRFTRRVEADGIVIYGYPAEDGWIANHHLDPHSYAVVDGPEFIGSDYVPPAGPFSLTVDRDSTLIDTSSSWNDERWRFGPVTITYGDGRTEMRFGSVTVE